VGVRDVPQPPLFSHTHTHTHLCFLFGGKGKERSSVGVGLGIFLGLMSGFFCGIGRDRETEMDRRERVWVLQPRKF
jgi:hypothetical protein